MEQIKSWNNTAQPIRFAIYAALVTESVLLRACRRKECSFQIGAREETSDAGSLPRKEENQIQIASPHYTEHNPRPAVLHDKSHESGQHQTLSFPLYSTAEHTADAIPLTFIPALNFHCQYHHQSRWKSVNSQWGAEVPPCPAGADLVSSACYHPN